MFFDPSDGTMVSRYVAGSVTLDVAGFRDLGAVARAGVAFRRLHDWQAPFESRFDLFEKIDEYLALVAKMGAPVPHGYAEVQAEAEAVRAALEGHDLPSAPCHCDPLAENFLDTGARIFIIDYEYAGTNDPMWDLGDLSVEAEFDDRQERVMLEAYFDGEAPAFEVGRMVMYKAMCDLLWTLWGVIQVANDNPADDFEAYVTTRLERCRVLMATDDFPRHLKAVRKG
jgi:thiamine kinase-like enzyme